MMFTSLRSSITTTIGLGHCKITGTPPILYCLERRNSVTAITTYQQLDDNYQQFRLLRLIYNEGDQIACDLQNFTLRGRPPYTALSYCWTDQPPTVEITINGLPFFVRPNLHEYLKVLRDECHDGWVYIDAICINQNDDAEKAGQIQVMGEIYGGAREVVAWLGVDVDADDIVLSQSGSTTSLPRYVRPRELLLGYYKTTSDLLKVAGPALLSDIFFQWKYWSRLWIAQEVILARSLTIRCRTISIDADSALDLINTSIGFEYFERSSMFPFMNNPAEYESEPNAALMRHQYAMNTAYRFLTTRKSRLERHVSSDNSSLVSALLEVCRQDCSRLYDRVFGVLGLADSQLSVDYKMPVLELYLRVLAEGLLEVRRGKKTPINPASSTGDAYNEMITFIITLHSSLKLPPTSFIVQFLTTELLNIIDPNHGLSLYYWISIRIALTKRPIRAIFLHALLLFDCVGRRTWFNIRVRWSRLRDSRIKALGEGGEEKTLEEWSGRVHGVLDDVLERLRISRADVARLPEWDSAKL